MARPIKEGLDYFSLDTDIQNNDKIQYIEAEHGNIGFAVIIKIFCKIYGTHGYYTMMTEREQKLFSKRINVDINLINAVINTAVEENLFDKNIYKRYGVLTSKCVQERFIAAAERRKIINFERKYLLIPIPNDTKCKIVVKDDHREVNVNINSVDTDNNSINDSKSTQRKERKERNNICLINDFFEKVWSIYKRKEGKGKISDSKKKQLYELGDELIRAVERYNQKLERDKTDFKYIQMGSTFFNSGYIDYLDREYGQVATTVQPKAPVQIEIIEKEF